MKINPFKDILIAFIIFVVILVGIPTTLWWSFVMFSIVKNECSVEPEIYLLPNNFTGVIHILYASEYGQEGEYKGKTRIYRIPEDGILKTKFHRNQGWCSPENITFFLEDNHNQAIKWTNKSNFRNKSFYDQNGNPKQDTSLLGIVGFNNYGRVKNIITQDSSFEAVVSSFYLEIINRKHNYVNQNSIELR